MSWPPRITVGTDQAANLGDRVVGARKRSEDNLILMLRKNTTRTMYGLLLLLPEDVLDKVIAAIDAKIGITLREVEELDIS